MKSRIADILTRRTLAIMMAVALAVPSVTAQDYVVASAVGVNGALISSKVDETNDIQQSTESANWSMTYMLNDIRSYERKMYNYLSEAHGVVESAYEAVRCIDLTNKIISNLNACRKEAADHPQGLIVSAMISEEYGTIISEASSLVGYISSVVKSGSKDNLLNSYERMTILSNVQRRLYVLCGSTDNLRWQIACMRWADIGKKLAPDIYYSLYDTEAAYRETVAHINWLKGRL